MSDDVVFVDAAFSSGSEYELSDEPSSADEWSSEDEPQDGATQTGEPAAAPSIAIAEGDSETALSASQQAEGGQQSSIVATSTANLDALSTEILSAVLLQLDDRHSVAAFCEVNRRLNGLARDPSVIARWHLQHYGRNCALHQLTTNNKLFTPESFDAALRYGAVLLVARTLSRSHSADFVVSLHSSRHQAQIFLSAYHARPAEQSYFNVGVGAAAQNIQI